jgi:hypothetical protein
MRTGRGGSQVAENIIAVAQAATSTTHGASDTQTVSGELERMAAELQRIVSQFKYQENVIGNPKSEFRSASGPGHSPRLAGGLNAPTSTRIQ